MSKFDDAIAAMKAEHYDNPQTVQVLELMVEQNERIKNLEHFVLESKSRLGAVEKVQYDHNQSIGSLTKSRDEHETRVKAIESKPAEDTKKIDDLEKRVTVVEGAVGSKAYRRAEAKAEVAATDPVAPAKPHFWSPPTPETPKPDQTVPA